MACGVAVFSSVVSTSQRVKRNEHDSKECYVRIPHTEYSVIVLELWGMVRV